MIDILIPMSPDRYWPQICIDHILIQNIPFNLFFSNAKGDGAASARNHVKDMWTNYEGRSTYVLTSDNDLLLPEGSLQAMIDFLESNADYGAIALHRNQTPDRVMEDAHVNAGPVLYRSHVFEQITYHNNSGCECQGMTNDIRNLGYRIGYLNGFQYPHIENTRRNDVQ